MIPFKAVLQFLVAALATIARALGLVLGLGFGMGQVALAGDSDPIAEAFPLIFDSERIRIEVLDDSLEVRGTLVAFRRPWRRPLRHASFEIRLPPSAIPLEFSFPFERQGAGDETSYTYEARDFFPDRDIVVRWIY
ncbi:MAG: hypothetical protein KJ970_20710 [Candidatus Eisenbacteria bacterium]|uniref:Uncharacterized protein n=1 Tax=Eiseniibacteriota bacterium TaxID=2212470 RepID=A0A948RYH1_UNCEI|nr:hypothetical protein [Candidatus Eisenbacteria bacterium]MBU1947203.1 hypothetical protein [Candidatus Eisenbacteria bacterium]MBU2693348.1 hypothetical protein [Candidatus Eisenbacteria bacterium]